MNEKFLNFNNLLFPVRKASNFTEILSMHKKLSNLTKTSAQPCTKFFNRISIPRKIHQRIKNIGTGNNAQ